MKLRVWFRKSAEEMAAKKEILVPSKSPKWGDERRNF